MQTAKKKKEKRRLGKEASPSVASTFLRRGEVVFLFVPGSRRRWAGQVLVAVLVMAGFATLGLSKKHHKITKSVSGMVLDRAENGIAGAVVELTDVQSGKTLAIYSGTGGKYHFGGLSPDHDYKIQAKYKGASSEVRQVSSFDPRMRVVINLTLSGHKS